MRGGWSESLRDKTKIANGKEMKESERGKRERKQAKMEPDGINTGRILSKKRAKKGQIKGEKSRAYLPPKTDHFGNPIIAPVAMDQKEPLQKPELRNGKVTGHNCLLALQSTNSHPYIGLLDHPHIIGPIPYGHSHFSPTLLH